MKRLHELRAIKEDSPPLRTATNKNVEIGKSMEDRNATLVTEIERADNNVDINRSLERMNSARTMELEKRHKKWDKEVRQHEEVKRQVQTRLAKTENGELEEGVPRRDGVLSNMRQVSGV